MTSENPKTGWYEPVGMTEIAARANVRQATVEQWIRRHASFPLPRGVVGGRRAWHWPDVEQWLHVTGRMSAGEIRHFRYCDHGGSKTFLETDITDDGSWEALVGFVGEFDDDEGVQAFPATAYREMLKDPEIAACEALERWKAARTAWMNTHPGEVLLPDHLVSKRYSHRD